MQLDDRFTRTLPGDPSDEPHVRQVYGAAWSSVRPTPVRGPRTLAIAPEVADLLGLSPEEREDPFFAEVFSGNRVLPGMRPYSACYGGHQFGHWAGQLGDGRAITLGEVVSASGRWEIQLKGAGPTPYSRQGDGRAVLRSSVREFLCSEAMFHLGVPTTRALSLVTTGEDVVRDMFYDGHPAPEPGAIVCRVAPSFLRFGSYELAARRGETELLRSLVAFTLEEFYPSIGSLSPAAVVALFREVARRTVALVVDWMRVGFVHGVMNTDNLSILGLTMDYGPYGWLEPFDPAWTPNTTDASGRRYAFGNQPRVALWNLARLAEAWIPLAGAVEPLESALRDAVADLDRAMASMWTRKLGLDGDHGALIGELLRLLPEAEVDYILFFRALADVDAPSLDGPLRDAWYGPVPQDLEGRIRAWLGRYLAVAGRDRRGRMNGVNPKYVLRNYLAQLAIDRAATGDAGGLTELLAVLRRPYEDQPEKERFAARRPEWARSRPGCSALSCSS